MSETPNVATVRRLYASGMAPEVVAEIVSPELVWDISPGFPFGGIYHGWGEVGSQFFGNLAPNFTAFGAVPISFDGDGDQVFVQGHYHAERASGAAADIRFVHVWSIRDGLLTHLSQVADSHVIQELLHA